eukprot:CAMPEP_0181417568 /NCGR_PEP_ID=MMETSP1110-20121109/11107_1 /TAXON_ID=174948 /ORGANISM="Symbiodinium sp., Strain CCMP421" /LENGTH=202 /DNA_ID=CAMNT_0023540521 /DNA_START=151 /DNA_END=760 /DNA_ORIENTATION=+
MVRARHAAWRVEKCPAGGVNDRIKLQAKLNKAVGIGPPANLTLERVQRGDRGLGQVEISLGDLRRVSSHAVLGEQRRPNHVRDLARRWQTPLSVFGGQSVVEEDEAEELRWKSLAFVRLRDLRSNPLWLDRVDTWLITSRSAFSKQDWLEDSDEKGDCCLSTPRSNSSAFNGESANNLAFGKSTRDVCSPAAGVTNVITDSL